MLSQITPLILTYNEAPNIGRTLAQLCWATDIVVVDSFSDDNTLEIVSGFRQVRVFQRKFESFASQCNFGLTETNINNEWVLNLDADYFVTAELRDELSALAPEESVDGFRTRFTYCINGRRLNSGLYPPVTVLFRRAKAFFVVDGHAHRVAVKGAVEDLSFPMLHDDRKTLRRWFHSQVLYSKLEAEKLLQADFASLSFSDRMRRWRLVAPVAICFYCLVVRRGVLDGRAGFYYAFQRMVAELLLSLYLIEHDIRS